MHVYESDWFSHYGPDETLGSLQIDIASPHKISLCLLLALMVRIFA